MPPSSSLRAFHRDSLCGCELEQLPAKSSIDPRKPGDKKTMRYASSMRSRANPATG